MHKMMVCSLEPVDIGLRMKHPLPRHPACKQYLSILQFFRLLRRIKLEDINHNLQDEDVCALAAASHGYVGADLAALCQEAAMCALRRVVRHRQSAQSTTEASDGASWDPDAPVTDLLKVCFIPSSVTSRHCQKLDWQLLKTSNAWE